MADSSTQITLADGKAYPFAGRLSFSRGTAAIIRALAGFADAETYEDFAKLFDAILPAIEKGFRRAGLSEEEVERIINEDELIPLPNTDDGKRIFLEIKTALLGQTAEGSDD